MHKQTMRRIFSRLMYMSKQIQGVGWILLYIMKNIVFVRLVYT